MYLASLIGLLIGWKTRVCAIAAWLLHTVSVNSGYLSLYGVDTMIHVCLFYCAWMPAGECLSLDRYRSKRAIVPTFMARVGIRTLQLHLCIIYANTGIAKMRGEQWWSGEAIWRALMQPQFSVMDYSWLAGFPALAMLACWAVMFIECGYPVFIWPARTRPFWLVATVALHSGIGAMMGLWMFSLIMIVMNASAFGVELLDSSARGRREALESATAAPAAVTMAD